MHLISIAPMIDWTNTHFRVFMRMLAPNALLYTEMQSPATIQYNPKKALEFAAMEQPLVLQLGGSDPKALAETAKIGEDAGFAAINLNLGCPSDRVQAGQFGACLMHNKEKVAECIQSMKQAVSIPITAKTRIGVDQQDSYAFFKDFAAHLIAAGSDCLIVHARKAWLKGLNPKQNRTIPPINYDFVYQLKQEFPNIPIVLNGNITHIPAILDHLNKIDGVMLGRLALDNPYAIAEIHHHLYPAIALPTRYQLLMQYIDYIKEKEKESKPLPLLLKPLQNYAHALPNAKTWKKSLMGREVKLSELALDVFE